MVEGGEGEREQEERLGLSSQHAAGAAMVQAVTGLGKEGPCAELKRHSPQREQDLTVLGGLLPSGSLGPSSVSSSLQ